MQFKFFNTVVIIAVVCCLIVVPVSGFSFSLSEEKEVGGKLLYNVRSTFPVIESPDITNYLAKLGFEVTNIAGFQYFDYHFYVIDDKEFNAFAAPSGLIFFYTGLIEKMDSEDELFSVLAHEIGHVVKRHISSRIEKAQVINMASLGVLLAALALGDANATSSVLVSSLAAGQSLNLHFSRENEEEADRLAYYWMQKLGRSPLGQKNMLQKMRRILRYKMGQVPQYLLTHPDPEARLDYVQSLIEKEESIVPPDQSRADDIAFLRFKYRVLSLRRDVTNLRQLLSSIITKSEPDSLEATMAKYGLSQLDRQERNYQNSIVLLDQVINAFPDHALFKIDKGIELSEAGDNQQALRLLEAEYEKNTNCDYATYSLAMTYLRQGNLQRARSLLLQVQQSMEDFPGVYYQLGKIASLQQKEGEKHYYLGRYNLYQGKIALAEMNFKNAAARQDLDAELAKSIPKYLETIKKLKD